MPDTPNPLNVLLIVGSTRPGRTSDLVQPWLTGVLGADPRFDLNVEDLRDWPLPLFQEQPEKMGNPASPDYSDPLIGQWNKVVTERRLRVKPTRSFVFALSGVFNREPMSMACHSGGFYLKSYAL